MSQGCFLVLLSAMMVALAVGLLATAPIGVPQMNSGLHGSPWRGVDAIASLVLGFTAVGGWMALRRAPWPAAVRLAWSGFFLAALLLAATALPQLAAQSLPLAVLPHALLAAASTLLLLGLLAERADARFGSGAALALSLAAVAAASAWSLWGDGAAGDLRALLLMQSLAPLALVAGAPALDGHTTSAADARWLLSACSAAMLAGLAGSLVDSDAARQGVRVLMLLASACGVAKLAHRAAAAGRRHPAASTQRSTSLNTSG